MAASSTHDAHAARKPAAMCLADMPAEVIERILTSVSDLRTLMAANATSRLFHGAPGGRSPVEHALRERARARGHERALLAALPPGVCSWTSELFARERLLQLAHTHRHVVACGRADQTVASAALSAFVDAEGGLHTCGEEEARDEDTGRSTGEYGAMAALGHGGVRHVLVPTRVASLSAVRLVAVAAGWAHLLTLSEAGTVYTCGENGAGQLGMRDVLERRTFCEVKFTASEYLVCIAAGLDHSLALTAAGSVYSWGHNNHGQLGHGDTKERWEPTRVEALDGVRVGGLVAGGMHTLMLSAGGAVYSCGNGRWGQLGHRDEQDQLTPRRIEALVGVRAVHVSAGNEHNLVVDAEGGAYSFGGTNNNSELGHNGDVGDDSDDNDDDAAGFWAPTRIEALAAVHAVRACAGHSGSAVVCARGRVYAFGNNGYGQLCGGDCDDDRPPAPVQVFRRARVLDVALGDDGHALYVTADGAVYSCGEHTAARGLGVSAADYEDEQGERIYAQHWLTRIEQLPRLGSGPLMSSCYC